MAGKIRIGISGWTYPPWRGVFYPDDLPHRSELAYASRALRTIEINGTFYSLQRATSFHKWSGEVPDDFVFSVKANRFITHIRRLRDVKKPMANFFASGLLELGRKLGPVLWQFPPSFKFDPALLDEFFSLLPRDMDGMVKLARRHEGRLPGKAALKPRADGPVRHAMEVRHFSFQCEEFVSLLREHDVALVVADTAGKWPFMEDVTSDFIYLRLHGDEELYTSGYSPSALDNWEKKISRWAKGGSPRGTKRITPAPAPMKSGRDVFAYFDNDVKVHAPFDAMALARRLGMDPRYEEPPPGRPEAKRKSRTKAS